MHGTRLKKLLKGVLSGIRPTPKEAEGEIAFAGEIARKLKKCAGNEVVITGSIAKRTFLKGGNDIDIFILFPKAVPKDKFEKLARAAVESAFPGEHYSVSYAEHPYVRLHAGGRMVDVVPAYRILKADELSSAVDRSVLHTKFILDSMATRQIDEVLLLKKFLQCSGLYGAEIRVQGFSGYLCELLVLYYKNFPALLKAACKWRLPVFIDIKKHYGKKEGWLALKKFNSPIVVIDPTDKDRNVAAAVSGENAKRFVLLAKKFLAGPGTAFFTAEKTFWDRLHAMEKKKGSVYLITLDKPDIVDDVLWGQIRKLERQLGQHLAKKDFRILEMLADSDRNISIAMRLAKDCLSGKRLLTGPAVSLKQNAAQFRRSHKGARFIIKKINRQRRICAFVKRDVRTAEDAIRMFFRSAVLPSHLNRQPIAVQKFNWPVSQRVLQHKG